MNKYQKAWVLINDKRPETYDVGKNYFILNEFFADLLDKELKKLTEENKNEN